MDLETEVGKMYTIQEVRKKLCEDIGIPLLELKIRFPDDFKGWIFYDYPKCSTILGKITDSNKVFIYKWGT